MATEFTGQANPLTSLEIPRGISKPPMDGHKSGLDHEYRPQTDQNDLQYSFATVIRQPQAEHSGP